MTIYMDVVFLINLLYQLGILKILVLLFRLKCTNGRIVIGAAVGSIIYCICIFTGFIFEKFPGNVLWGLGIGSISLAATFYPIKWKLFRRLLYAQLIVSFCLNGILNLLSMEYRKGYLMLTAMGALVFLCFFSIGIRNAIFEKLHKEKYSCKVRLVHKGKEIVAKGFVDTGNGLKDPMSGEAVILLQKSIADTLLLGKKLEKQPGYRLIPYGSIGVKKGLLEAFRLEYMEIIRDIKGDEPQQQIYQHVLCAVYGENMDNSDYEVILHPLLL